MSETDTIKPDAPAETPEQRRDSEDRIIREAEGRERIVAPFLKNTEPRFKTIWQHLDKQRVVIQEKGGNIITGLYVGKDEGFLKLANAEVKGRGVTVQPGTVWVDRTSIAHIHKETENKEKTPKGDKR